MKKDERYRVIIDYYLGSINIKGHILDIVDTRICNALCTGRLSNDPCNNIYVTYRIHSVARSAVFTECIENLKSGTEIVISKPDNIFESIL